MRNLKYRVKIICPKKTVHEKQNEKLNLGNLSLFSNMMYFTVLFIQCMLISYYSDNTLQKQINKLIEKRSDLSSPEVRGGKGAGAGVEDWIKVVERYKLPVIR